MKVFAINGSARKDGNTAILIRQVLAELERQGIETEMVQLAGHVIRGCTVCNQCQTNLDGHCAMQGDIVNDCIDKMAAADGIILGSPTYFADITPELKALIDRSGKVSGANGGLFKRKVGAGVIAVRRGGAIHALDSIHHFLHISQMVVPGSCYWNMGIGRQIGEVEQDEEGLRTMQVLGENMAWLLKLIAADVTAKVSSVAVHAAVQAVPGQGLHHISVHSSDLDRSLRLYRDLLGMPVVNDVPLPDGRRIVLLDAGDGSHVELTVPAGADTGKEEAPLLHLALRPRDARQVIEKVRAAGFEITVEPRDVKLGAHEATIAFLKGPEGELIELFQTNG